MTQTFSLCLGSSPLAVRLNHILKTSSPTGTRNANTQEWQGGLTQALPSWPRESCLRRAPCHKLWGLGQLPSRGPRFCICNMGIINPVLSPPRVPRTPRESSSGRMEMDISAGSCSWSCNKFGVPKTWQIHCLNVACWPLPGTWLLGGQQSLCIAHLDSTPSVSWCPLTSVTFHGAPEG